ncbi:cell division protein FtsQ/DivIB [Tuberibacillus sp. Marseille-P3662]|uniref:cell division protein FtsQ/DivIB n=1 Tax=Tuberibacillus sp. Marseille-P3662 TaxID=1965358 RepID=UPI001594A758|nr:FtsQ-type POTRA domain-containing protein [Tuberibacillus sp. Marseille-P3662]
MNENENNVINLDERVPKLKEQRKHKSNRRFIIYITLFFIIILVTIYFQSPLSTVKHIQVEGNQIIPAKTIIKQSGITKSSHVWDLDEQSIQNRLKDLDTMKSISVDVQFYNKVVLTVTEYQRIGYLKRNEHYVPLLENGQFAKSMDGDSRPVDAPIFFNWDEGDPLEKLTQSLKKIPASTVQAISEIHFTPNKYSDGITLYMNNGLKVLARINNLADKIKMYPSIVNQIPKNAEGFVDLRVGAFFESYEKESQDSGQKVEQQ